MQAHSRESVGHTPQKLYNDPRELAEILKKLSSQQDPVPPSRESLPLHPAKRIKLDPEDRTSHATSPTDRAAQSATLTPPIDDPIIPLIPHLFHLAVTARAAASRHLQQIFIPAHVNLRPRGGIGGINASPHHGAHTSYQPDVNSRDKALGLLVLALDLLREGLNLKGVSEKDRVVFGTEFGQAAMQLLQSNMHQTLGGIDMDRIRQDAWDTIGNAVSPQSGNSTLKRPAVCCTAVRLPASICSAARTP